jgi:hypothetical protein
MTRGAKGKFTKDRLESSNTGGVPPVVKYIFLGFNVMCLINFNRKLNFYNALWVEKLTKI